MISQILNKIMASLAISGLVFLMTSPALASVDYDPNDPYFDPSGTYVIPAPVAPAVDASSSSEPAVSGPLLSSPSDSDQTIINTTPTSSDQNSGSLETSVIDTGENSDNDIIKDNQTTTNTDVTNDADVNNNTTASSETGNNQSSQNTGNGSVETGNSDLVANIISSANSVIDGVNSMALPIINFFGDLIGDLSFDGGSENIEKFLAGKNISDIVSNSATGTDSTNTSTITDNNSSETNLNNDGQIENDLKLSSNSGDNKANQNTGDGSITTGDANIASNVVNFLNNSILSSNWWMGMVNVFGNWTGNLLLPSLTGSGTGSGSTNLNATNSQTGFDSTNTALSEFSNSSDTTIDNNANIIDEVDINANSGGNESLKNTLDGTIQTGDVNIKNNQLTVANNTITGDSWWMLLVNTLQGWTGAIIGSPDGTTSFMPFLFGGSATNVETGADSTNTASIEVNNNEEAQVSNDANINNHLTLDANTGYNQANKNTGSGNIQTGDANVMSNLVNFVNNTFNVNKWLFGIVNVFGTWDGSAQFGNSGTNSGVSLDQNSSLSAENQQTGADSTNTATVSDEQKNELEINNNLNVRSNIKIKGNTGNNKTDKNTGNGSILTGDIDSNSTMSILGNITKIELPGSESNSNISASNIQTGADSNNNAFIKIIGKMKLVINNVANIYKNVAMNLNTGDNSSDKNTGNGEIQTGNIEANFTSNDVVNIVEISSPEEESVIPEKGGREDIVTIIPTENPALNEVLSFGGVLPLVGQKILWPLLVALVISILIQKRRFLIEKFNKIRQE